MLKSRPDRYGAIAVSIHWLSAVLILALLGSGFRAANAMDAATKAGLLRFHIPVAIVVLLLTALRIVWWWRFDRKPAPVQASPRWQERLAGFADVVWRLRFRRRRCLMFGFSDLTQETQITKPARNWPVPRPIRRSTLCAKKAR
ncbi:cytochrome b [Rhizobium leguminosarum]|uniref:cytochrome b n=1 Tax=Rhizobium leguminosarum TaxID=384 RepID=UPI003F94F52A